MVAKRLVRSLPELVLRSGSQTKAERVLRKVDFMIRVAVIDGVIICMKWCAHVPYERGSNRLLSRWGLKSDRGRHRYTGSDAVRIVYTPEVQDKTTNQTRAYAIHNYKKWVAR